MLHGSIAVQENMTFLCKASELPDGEVKQIEIPGCDDPFALYNLGGEFFLTDGICTHAMAYLADGEIEGADIVCPLHGGAFDIRTGEATVAPCRDALRTYEVVRQGEDLYARLSAA